MLNSKSRAPPPAAGLAALSEAISNLVELKTLLKASIYEALNCVPNSTLNIACELIHVLLTAPLRRSYPILWRRKLTPREVKWPKSSGYQCVSCDPQV